MGMFDYVEIVDSLLPDEIKGENKGWQTKSHNCSMDTIRITETRLLIRDSWSDEWNIGVLDYTGEISCSQSINEQRWILLALFEKGWFKSLRCVEPKLKKNE